MIPLKSKGPQGRQGMRWKGAMGILQQPHVFPVPEIAHPPLAAIGDRKVTCARP